MWWSYPLNEGSSIIPKFKSVHIEYQDQVFNINDTLHLKVHTCNYTLTLN